MGGSTISYVDVATFEVGICGQTVRLGLCDTIHLRFHDTVPIIVCNLKRLHLNYFVVDDISINMDDLLDSDAIFHFKGFWPSFSDFHAWISRVWEPIISKSAQIYPLERFFFFREI